VGGLRDAVLGAGQHARGLLSSFLRLEVADARESGLLVVRFDVKRAAIFKADFKHGHCRSLFG
jgi:hypothetical protein